MSQKERSLREWSRWDASDMDGQTREGEVFRAETESIGATWMGKPQAENSGSE
jgi:hypothetical protein